MSVKPVRMIVSSIGLSAMSIKRFCRLVYEELDNINKRLKEIESLIDLGSNSEELNEELTIDTFRNSIDTEKLNNFSVSIGIKSNKNKSVKTLKSDIEKKLKEEK